MVRRNKQAAEPMPLDPDQYLPITQTAQLMAVSERTVQRLVAAGELRPSRIGLGNRRLLRFRVGDIREYCQRSRQVADAAE
jgi:excisionase family DNA binding protein